MLIACAVSVLCCNLSGDYSDDCLFYLDYAVTCQETRVMIACAVSGLCYNLSGDYSDDCLCFIWTML